MATIPVQIRIDTDLKKQLEVLLEQLGLDLPTATRMFYKKMVISGGVPFDVKVDPWENYYTPEKIAELDELAEEALAGKNVSRTFTSVEDLIKDLNS